MSLQRRASKAIRPLNELLGRELGRTAAGDPWYAWFWSEDLQRPKRVYAKTDEGLCLTYRNVERDVDGKKLFVAEPLYEVEKLCPHLHNCYILCVWIPGQSFSEWRTQFDDTMEWPKGGEYFPVSSPTATAYVREKPTEEQTWQVIRWVKKDRQTAMNMWLRVYEQNDKTRIKDDRERTLGELDNILPAYDNIPGSRSFPIAFMAETKVDPRIAAADLNRMGLDKFKPQPKGL